jgi:hypothetical protein
MNRNNNIVAALLTLLTSAAVGCVSEVGDAPDEGGSGVSVRLAALEAGSSRIEYSLTNHGSTPVRVLAWKTGLSQAHDPLFEIYRDGSKLDYRGPIFLHAQPQPSHFIEVAPGERVSAQMDLAESYDLRAGGTYEIRPLALEPGSVLGDEALELDTATALRIHVDADHAAVVASSEALTIASCSAEQASTLETARAQALDNAREAMEYVDEHGYDERALRWFGTGNTQAAYKVQNGMHVIHDLLEANTFRFICQPASHIRCWYGTWAFVNPWDTSANKVINFCPPVFPEATPTGRDSMAVTITHETAHFFTKDVDYKYGVDAALQLARDKPDTARKNAENYALYTIDSQLP